MNMGVYYICNYKLIVVNPDETPHLWKLFWQNYYLFWRRWFRILAVFLGVSRHRH